MHRRRVELFGELPRRVELQVEMMARLGRATLCGLQAEQQRDLTALGGVAIVEKRRDSADPVRLLRETGIKPVRGCAPGGVPPPPNGSTSPGAQSCGSRPTSARPPSRSGGVQTQTRPPKSFFEMLQDQKRKDGVL